VKKKSFCSAEEANLMDCSLLFVGRQVANLSAQMERGKERKAKPLSF